MKNIVGRVSFADSGDITYMADVRLLSGAGVINGIRNVLAARKNLSDELTPASACIEDLVNGAQYMKTAKTYAEAYLRTNSTEDYNHFATWYKMSYDLLQDAEEKSYDTFDVILDQLLPGGY